jgi:hypothetical protein
VSFVDALKHQIALIRSDSVHLETEPGVTDMGVIMHFAVAFEVNVELMQ